MPKLEVDWLQDYSHRPARAQGGESALDVPVNRTKFPSPDPRDARFMRRRDSGIARAGAAANDCAQARFQRK